MGFRVTLFPGFFRGDFERDASNAALDIMLECLVQLDLLHLQTSPDYPLLYQSGVRYKTEGLKREDWLTIPEVIKRRFGDCEDLAAWRTAELRMQGIAARACFSFRKMALGGTMYHIKVLYPDGREEDPSKILGMNSKADA